MLILRLDAPFGVFRTFTAGSFRPTASFITPSAAYGLLLNIAGIEMRHDNGKSVATLIRPKGLPAVDIALGARGALPRQQSMFQQLHNYPVGTSGKEHKAAAKGNKYNITPTRRAFLSEIHAYIAVRGDEGLEEQVTKGLSGETARTYGLPFMGDNSFLPDRLEVVEQPEPARWYEVVDEADEDGVREDITRLTVIIDRIKMENTRSALFAPQQIPSAEIPERAWVRVAY
ncbi:MAG: type I-MYXAN CRISPR-associated protein Cas5/Cmx5/DevS [Candidatus Electrothrix sp. GW3-4]|uniref:type I-MYXAN CRISPR-associated protein Cas5/Cmx5/DevS n=1 Tax=Candidatus Electrothrix sp. GW3-4 TaxID=3126740 RepID=UPI0030CB21EB